MLTVNTKGGKAYINGILPKTKWEDQLLKAGCTATKTGDLKIPDGKNPKEFLVKTLGAENLKKYGDVTYNDLSNPAASKEAGKSAPAESKGEKKEHAFEVVEKGEKAYINDIKEDSKWHKQLIEAGCTVTKTGGLLVPEGKKASKFLNEVLGKENMLKYGGYSLVKDDAEASKKAEQPASAENGSVQVFMDKDKKEPTMVIVGLHKEDSAAHKIIKEAGGRFKDAETNPHWEIVNPKVTANILKANILATMVTTAPVEESKSEKKEHAFEVVEKGDKAYINDIKADSKWYKQLVEAGCTVTKTGGLLVPEGKKASKFLNEVLGKENMLKYGGYSLVKDDAAANAGKKKAAVDPVSELINKEVKDMTVGEVHSAMKELDASLTRTPGMSQS
ncbi:MAG: hypothetical protein A3F91_09335 [Flavobacteria bacterium RIFCSPLOWO2_12_FULL_35_11]|nr:MAG: hypothetical protein A3F91_09335 [Flavobacteria bacterium RIFCSPLOWO2_12_FULL_35_11]